jgi:hypothetical protein
VPSDRAIQLADLAKRLRLTPLQTDFALALAADPKGNQIRAAVAAGVSRLFRRRRLGAGTFRSTRRRESERR